VDKIEGKGEKGRLSTPIGAFKAFSGISKESGGRAG